jgi:hypothetical protein
VGGGLKLVRADPPDDCKGKEAAMDWFVYQHSAAYQQLQR